MRVLMVAGEASGDAHAAKLARRLREQGAEIAAVGGAELQGAGARMLAHLDELAVLGFVEVVQRLPRLVALKRDLETRLRRAGFDLFIPVDYPGLNLRLCHSARRAGVPVLYYVGPQVWAWRARRLQHMRRSVRHVALILPFEKPLYEAAGVPATFVGHPLLDDPPTAQRQPDRDLGLFPGSRPQEVRHHLPLLLEAARILRQRHPHLRVLVSRAPTSPLDWMRRALAQHGFDPQADLCAAPARESMPRARALLVASGTATLEAAVARRPFAVVYRTGRINYAVARRLVRVPYVALANLVAGEPVVREYIQDALRPDALAQEAQALLFDAPRRERVLRGLQRVVQRLGAPGASERVAHLAREIGTGGSVEMGAS